MSYHSILRNSRAVPPYPVLYNFHKFNVQCSFQEGEEGAKGRKGEGGGRGSREGVSYYHILSPKPPLSFQQQSIISLCRLGEKKDLFPICNHPTKGMTGKSTEKIPLFPRLKVWQFSSTCSE